MELRLKGEVCLDADLAESDGLTVLETIADDRKKQEELLGEYEEEHILKQQVAKAVEGLNDCFFEGLGKNRHIQKPLKIRGFCMHVLRFFLRLRPVALSDL